MSRDRYFISLDLTIPVIESLLEWQERVNQALEAHDGGAQIRWVAPERVHVTLKDLGRIDHALTERISEQLVALAEPLFPFHLGLREVGVDDAKAPRFVWAGFDPKGAEVMGLLRRAIEQSLGQLGIEADPRPFHPKMILGRVWAPGGAPEGAAMVGALGPLWQKMEGQSTVRDLMLTRCKFSSGEPLHKVVNRYGLGAEARKRQERP